MQNMSYLVGTFLEYCDEQECFIALTNLIHQHYFLNLFRGFISDVKLRVALFEQYFKQNLPDLYEHFEFLEIETAFYLTDWMLTCFVNVIDFKIACRIIDCFLLDGEVFIFKTGIALLIYFQSTLIKSSHY